MARVIALHGVTPPKEMLLERQKKKKRYLICEKSEYNRLNAATSCCLCLPEVKVAPSKQNFIMIGSEGSFGGARRNKPS